MAATITASAVRFLTGDAEDVFDAFSASGYTPEKGDLVAVSGNNEVDGCDATDANSLTVPAGVVESFKLVNAPAGGTRYRVTVRQRGLMEGFTSLTAGNILYTSATAEKFDETDPTASGITGYPVALVKNATQALINCPVLG